MYICIYRMTDRSSRRKSGESFKREFCITRDFLLLSTLSLPMDFYRSILINDRVRENCRVGGVRASIHVKNFPFIRLTQRVPVIEITCEANCDNLTLVRPSFVHGSASIFFPPIIVTLFPRKIDNDYTSLAE